MTTIKVEYCKNCGNDIHALDKDGKRICPVCAGISDPSNFGIKEIKIDDFKCVYCKKKATDSSYFPNLPFINIKEGNYYCGCRGWD